MELWIDAQVSPAMAEWMRHMLAVDATAVRDLGLREAEDLTIFWRARAAGVVVLTKDSDFVVLLERHGPPPQVVWLSGVATRRTPRCVASSCRRGRRRRLRSLRESRWSNFAIPPANKPVQPRSGARTTLPFQRL